MINIPCGVCAECRSRRQSDLAQRAALAARDCYCYFATLTYSPEALPYFLFSDGKQVPFADIRDIRLAIKRLRKNNSIGRPFKYLVASERGKKKGRPHFHAIFFVGKRPGDTPFTPISIERTFFRELLHEWRRFSGSRRYASWQPLCEYKCIWKAGRLHANYDLHYVRPDTSKNGLDDVSYYVTKYIIKGSSKTAFLYKALRSNYDEDEFLDAWPIIKDHMLISKNFGMSSEEDFLYIRRCVSLSRENPRGFLFYSPVSGTPKPLARYYQKKLYKRITPFGDIEREPLVTAADFVTSIDARGGRFYTLFIEKSQHEIDVKQARFDKMREKLRESPDIFDYLE